MVKQNRPEKRSRGVSPRVVTGLVLVALAVVFILENRHVVDIRVFVPVVTMPLWTALVAVMLVGIVVGLLLNRQKR
ncbi:uncharacterized protein DUF1049 [Saccharopolyspora erythraea NRRL 2338]|uniref:Uncharacterized protein n=2 Tax=Saccharopolyspora erythraea TaxID=1836 RepID=A4F625_SACEN|nr:lipopolysaccharide assembly protein LapA domain-containing protein [Saccharopolyspora erythraea]EQD88099.1 hypothetical protein N599_00735 [Saccharopolyspora erythraea D]PFG93298.1 uncharacterized protein DUF1049 [Saccharopolyspora erythraea NRRL 2338]QRK90143.1 DUF1049 domain-containing protein [Saccharopolyspora erythraea]CAL99499.1 hypothetical protein SACE_0147 [Saccharopolyspora erythraea NRRL 2338]